MPAKNAPKAGEIPKNEVTVAVPSAKPTEERRRSSLEFVPAILWTRNGITILPKKITTVTTSAALPNAIVKGTAQPEFRLASTGSVTIIGMTAKS